MTTTHSHAEDRNEKILKSNIQKRFDEMFSGKGQPLSNMSIQEAEDLKARVAELEARLEEQQEPSKRSVLSPGNDAQLMDTTPIAENQAKQASSAESTSHPLSFRSARAGLSASIARFARTFGTYRTQTRLTALILLTTVPMLIGITSFITSRTGAMLEANANQDLQQNNEGLATTLETWLELNVLTLQEMTLLPDIVNMEAQQQRTILQSMARVYPYMYLVSTTDLTGINVARNDDAEPKDYSDRDWFQKAKAGAPVTYQSLMGKTSGSPALVVSTPIRDASGQIVGVGMFAANLTKLSEETSVRAVGETGYVYIVDANNKVLAHPDPTYTADELYDLSQYPPVAALRQGQVGLMTFTDESGKHWRAYISILDNGWGIITQQQEAEILAPVRQFQGVAITLIAVGSILMLVLSGFSIRRTFQPINELTNSVSAIAAGDLNRVVDVKSKDEIGVLASTFNNMTVQLRSLVGTLEKRVADRTHDLELASEVGRIINEKTSDPRSLLVRATETIRERFNLYYAQIYLTDLSGQKLILHAGTGKVGEELLRRGHQLAIGPGSLNGRAAAERRAVILSDTEDSPSFLSNPLLPNTRSELCIPLMVGGKMVGVLDMQSEQPGALNETNLPAFEALAGQLAIAVENAALFAQAGEARAEVEAQVRRLTEQGWQDFLNAIDRGQKIGFAFDQSTVIRLKPEALSTSDQNTLSLPITITGTRVGEICFPAEHKLSWTNHELELVQTISTQLAQHIENLRLLARAEGFRKEAEQAARRLTREGWNTYFGSSNNLDAGYIYDLNQVQHLSMNGTGHADHALKQLLIVRDETIGELAVDAANHPDEAAEILSAVAQQLSGHIENLRLLEQTQQALIQTEELSRQNELILDTAGEGIFGLDEKGNHTFVNPAAAGMLGYAIEELIGAHSHSVWHHSHPDGSQYPAEKCPIYTSLREGKIYQGEEYFWRKDGGGFLVDFTSTPVQEGDHIIGAVVTFRDITERKKSDEIIRQAHERAQIILESVTIPMVITRLSDNHLTFVNPPALEVTQLKYEDVINQPSPNFYVNLEDRKNFITELQAKGRVSDKVVQLRGENNQAFWALLSARTFDYQGEASILTTFMDITDRIRAEEAVVKRAAELQTVAEVSTTTATTLEPDRLLQTVVDLTKEHFGLYHAHIYLANESWNTLLLAAGAGEVGRQMVSDGWNIPMDHEQSIVASAARNRQSVIANDLVREANSSFLSNQLLPDTRSEMAVPMIVGDKVLGVFDVQSDTVNYFSAEDANIFTTLATQTAIALQNARLYAEQAATLAQLRELDRLKSSFLANMSHELRTPLNSILGFTDVILEGLDGPLTEYMNNDLRLVQKNGQHLLHLINDVLDMAKIEAGRMNLNPEVFKVHEVLDEVTSITSTLASEKNLSLSIDECSDQNIEIYADHTRLRQVMINLVNNSIKFTETGKISLSVSPTDGARVLISVRDTGIGIPPEKLEAIFQEFTQVDSSTTRKTGGTGLGLPISRRLVEMHGGRLWAESTGIPGEGSTFFVELPIEARITEVVEKQEK